MDWLAERRSLLGQVLGDYARRGGTIIVPPPSKAWNDPAVLDTLDTRKVLLAVTGPTTRPLELSLCTSREAALARLGPRTTNDSSSGHPPSHANPFLHSASAPSDGDANPFAASNGGAANPFAPANGTSSAGSAAMGPAGSLPVASAATSSGFKKAAYAEEPQEEEEDDNVPPELQMAIMDAGLEASDVALLAYSLSAAACMQQPQYAQLLQVLRGQLEVDESRAQGMNSALRHVMSGSWTPGRRCSVEGLLAQLASARPHDFSQLGIAHQGMHEWVKWRGAASQALRAAVDHWPVAGLSEGDAKRLRARVKGALRRLDVRDLDELDSEGEYAEAVASLCDAMRQLAFHQLPGTLPPPPQHNFIPLGAPSPAADGWARFDEDGSAAAGAMTVSNGAPGSEPGWRWPWPLRARVVESLLGAQFDSLGESGAEYVAEVSALHGLLEGVLWPALGVSQTLVTALNAWAHFRAYATSGDARVARQLKHLLLKLANLTSSAQVPLGNGSLPATDEAADVELAREVGRLIVASCTERLSDYHAAFSKRAPSPEQALQVELDLTVFAARAQGQGEGVIEDLLVGAVQASLSAALARATKTAATRQGGAQGPAVKVTAAQEVWGACTRTYASVLTPHLPAAPAAMAACIHLGTSADVRPWLQRGLSIEPASVALIKQVIALDTELDSVVGPVQQSVMAAAYLASRGGAPLHDGQQVATPCQGSRLPELLKSFRRWEIETPLNSAMLAWCAGRGDRISGWVNRGLEQERWVPVSERNPVAQVAVEIVTMVNEAMDTLVGMDLPVDGIALSRLMDGVDTAFSKTASAIISKLGPVSRLIPPAPELTRYKKDVVAKQERVEAELANTALTGPKPKKKGMMSSLMDDLKIGSSSKAEGVFLSSVPRVEQSPDYAVVNGQLTNSVVRCCLLSASYLAHSADAVTDSVSAQRVRMRTTLRDSVGGATQSPDRLQAGAWLEKGRQALRSAVQVACRFLATKVVFWDQRTLWLESLYRHHVVASQPSGPLVASSPPYSVPMRSVLDALNSALEALTSGMSDPIRTSLARELLSAAASAYERVLLDGGPCRWFTVQEAPLLLRDLGALQELFEAEGEGLDESEVSEALRRPRQVVQLLMSLEVGPLMDALRDARARGSIIIKQGPSAPAAVFEEAVVLRVLAHRPERLGSKLLKEKYKLKKTLTSDRRISLGL